MFVYEDTSENKEILFYDKTVNQDKTMSLNDMGSKKIDYETGFPLDAQIDFFIDSIKRKNKNLENFELSINVVKILETLKK